MQGNDSFRLVVRRGPQPNQTYDLSKEISTLGRDITNDIVINDPEVSREHLRLTRSAEGITLEDLGSTNGTFVNGQRLSSPRQLNNGDMIGLGETVTLGFERVHPSGAGEVPPPPPPAAEPGAPDAGQAAAPAPRYEQPQPPPSYDAAPYQPSQPGYPSQAPQQPQQGQEYGQPSYSAPVYGTPQSPPPAGYDYDPYAVREEEGGNTMRWVGIGCLVLAIFCCCTTGVGLVLIDTLNLWYDLPIVRNIAPLLEQIARALGF